jgi:hypothetical protein
MSDICHTYTIIYNHIHTYIIIIIIIYVYIYVYTYDHMLPFAGDSSPS